MTFSTEGQYLIHLIACAIGNIAPEEKPEHLSFEKVYEIGIKHEVANIAFYSVEKLLFQPTEELSDKWRDRRDIAISRDINQSFARSEIVELFSESGIEIIELQGTEIKKLYPGTEYRTMSDIDFIIKIDNLNKAKSILEDLGYKCKVVDESEVDGFRSPNICVEIHTDYFPEYCEYHGILPSPFDVENVNKIDVFYAYNMLHIAKHYYGRGCGIRRVLDVYFLNKAYESIIDRKFVDSILNKAGIFDFVSKISILADCWFSGKDTPKELKYMEEYILYSGVHGNEKILMENHLKKSFKNIRLLKTKYFFKRIFPSRVEMCQKYPKLEKCVLLYPFCCVHRFFSTIFNKKKRNIVFETAKNVLSSNPERKI